MEKFGGDIFQKYSKIDRKGRQQVESGQVQEFTGFSESLKNRFLTALEFDSESRALIQERVINDLLLIEDDFGLRYSLAGRDFPLHSTLMEGLCENISEDERNAVFSNLEETVDFNLEGTAIKFDYVLLDGGSILLVASDIPGALIKARQGLAELYTTTGLKPLVIENILHCSLARIVSFPEDFDRPGYKKRIIDLRHSISNAGGGLVVRVDNLVREPSFDYLTGT